MSGISAFTFTGNAGAFFRAGTTPLIIYVANVASFLLAYLFLGAWFRQLRAITGADLAYARWGRSVEQLLAYLGLVLGGIGSAIWLWGLSTFSGVIFGLPQIPTILVLGLVVTLYSATGGRWAVMSTDFIQLLVLLPITILTAWLCLQQVGGVQGFVERIVDKEAYHFVKAPGQFPNNEFSAGWIVAIFLIQFAQMINMGNATKYFSAKDGREARRAALFAGVLMAFGSILWFVPPAVAGMVFEDQVLSSPLSEPAEGAYAIAAREVLPNGLMGLLAIAMLAATMSSMDTGLNGGSAMLVRNVIPPIIGIFGKKQLSDRKSYVLGRALTIFLGIKITAIAVYLSQQQGVGLFDAFLVLGASLGLPTTIPGVLGIFVRKVPSWAFFVSMGAGLIPSVVAIVSARVYDDPWSVQEQALWVAGASVIGFFAARPFFRYSSAASRARAAEFFSLMEKPVDFIAEVGSNRDRSLSRILGLSAVATGAFLSLYLLFPNTAEDRWGIVFVILFAISCGIFLLFFSNKIPEDAAATKKQDESP